MLAVDSLTIYVTDLLSRHEARHGDGPSVYGKKRVDGESGDAQQPADGPPDFQG